jgi:hypothetical protein
VTKAPSTNRCFIGTTPFKIRVNFYIPLFEIKIDEEDLDIWDKLEDDLGDEEEEDVNE